MKSEDLLSGKKEIIVEFFIGILFVVGIYYLFNIVRESSSPVTTSAQGASLNSDFNNLLNDLDKNKISLDNISFQKSPLFEKMSKKDFSMTISPSNTTGRDNPFNIYVTPRSSN